MSYTNAVFYLDYINGSDTARTDVVPSDYANNGIGLVRVTTGVNTLVTDAVVTIAGTTGNLYIGAWKITVIDTTHFDLQNSTYTSNPESKGTCIPFGGGTWTDAWKTITTGATTSRIAPGDIIRIAKSPTPVSLGNATWTDAPIPTAKNVGGTADNGLIRITINAHGYSTNDAVQILAVGGTVEANGTWLITYITVNTFDLQSSAYVNAYTSGGTCQKINSKAVVLDTARTLNIAKCEVTNWSAGAGGDTTPSVVAVSTDAKEGGYCEKLLMDSATQTNKLQAYFATGALNLGSYQKISFWFKNSAAVADTVTWIVALCSDSAGATPVDIFQIPTIPSSAIWLPLTLTRAYSVAFTGGTGTAPAPGATVTGATSSKTAIVITSTLSGGTWAGGDASGVMFVYNRSGVFVSEQVDQGANHFHITTDFVQGNLSSSVASIAVYSGATAPTNSCNILVDNFIACVSGDLNLQSLISQNSAEAGGNEGWYGIQSINNRIILLDNDAGTTKSNAGQGYTGTGGSISTYSRETIKTTLSAGVGNVVQVVQDSGTLGNLIDFEGGFNTGFVNQQDGETFFDGFNGQDVGLQISVRNYITTNRLNFVRYRFGLYLNGSYCCNVTAQTLSNCNRYGLYPRGIKNSILTVNNNCNTANYGIWLDNYTQSTTFNIVNLNNNLSHGIFVGSDSNNNILNITNAKNNVGYGIYLGAPLNYINNLTTINNTTGGIFTNYGAQLRNCNLQEITTPIGGLTQYNNAKVYSWKHGQQANNDYVYTDGGTINKQSGIVQPDPPTGYAWNFAISQNYRTSDYPLSLPIADIAVNADALVTVKVYMKKDHATNIGAQLICKGGQLAGVPNNIVDVKVNDTNWEQLTITFTPTEAGVITIEAQVWYITANSNAYIDTLEVSQA